MSAIAKIWGQNIIKGKRMYKEVPKRFKEDVKQYLIEVGHSELLED